MKHGAIETEYKGLKFRSRLEARWAVFFDKLKIAYQYEAQGYEANGFRYLPDFYLPDLKDYVEVKGTTAAMRDEARRMYGFVNESSPLPGFADGDSSLIVLGEVPEASGHNVIYHPVFMVDKGSAVRRYTAAMSFDNNGMFIPTSNSISDWIIGVGERKTESSPESSCWTVEPFVSKVENPFIGGEKVVEAYRAARQARFEYGEVPA